MFLRTQLSIPVAGPRPTRRLQLLAMEARMLFDGAGAVALFEPTINHDPTGAADCRVLDSDQAVVNGQAIVGNAWGDHADIDPDGDPLHVEGIKLANRTSLSQGDVGQANVGQTLNGEYGSLVMQSDGSYTYTPNANLPIAPGERLTEVFTYSLCDNQGGAAQTTLTLTIIGAPADPAPAISSDSGKQISVGSQALPSIQTGFAADGRKSSSNPSLPQFSAPLAQAALIPLSDIRPVAPDLPRRELAPDAFAPFSPERILGVVQESGEPLKNAAIETKPAQDDCVAISKPVTEIPRSTSFKPIAVRPSVFAKDGLGVNKNFSDQINTLKKAFKPPVKVRPAAIAKDC